jgi:hypothetical protein
MMENAATGVVVVRWFLLENARGAWKMERKFIVYIQGRAMKVRGKRVLRDKSVMFLHRPSCELYQLPQLLDSAPRTKL